jgi:hypothetical protein
MTGRRRTRCDQCCHVAATRASLWLATGLAVSIVASVADAETLLLVRPASAVLEFVDPGSGLRLASVPVGGGPRQVRVAPDGKQAVVLSCGTRPGATANQQVPPVVALSVVALEQPSELRRLQLALQSCPTGLAWFTAGRIAVATDEPAGWLAVSAGSGQILGSLSAADEGAVAVINRDRPLPDPATAGMQEFMSAGGDPDAPATTPIQPLAPCHACTPSP